MRVGGAPAVSPLCVNRSSLFARPRARHELAKRRAAHFTRDRAQAIKRYLATHADSLPWPFASERGTQTTRQTVN